VQGGGGVFSPFTCQTVEFEVGHEEPAEGETPFGALMVLSPTSVRVRTEGEGMAGEGLTFHPFAMARSVPSLELS